MCCTPSAEISKDEGKEVKRACLIQHTRKRGEIDSTWWISLGRTVIEILWSFECSWLSQEFFFVCGAMLGFSENFAHSDSVLCFLLSAFPAPSSAGRFPCQLRLVGWQCQLTMTCFPVGFGLAWNSSLLEEMKPEQHIEITTEGFVLKPSSSLLPVPSHRSLIAELTL